MVEPDPPIHISSFVVRCLPDKLPQVMRSVETLDGAEIHGSDPRGKFVVLLEQESEAKLVGSITRIELTSGVINTSMVYHHIE